jgi:hypothetical protein
VDTNHSISIYRFIAKILIFCMIMQGVPAAQLSQTYKWEFQPQRLIRILSFLSIFTPGNAHAETLSENGSYVSIFGPKQYLHLCGRGFRP